MPAPIAMFAQKSAEAQTAVTAESSADGVPAGFSILGNNSTPPPGYEWTGEALGDPEATHWTPGTPMPPAPAQATGDTINGKWYLSSGNQLHEFDPAADLWTRKANLPITRSAAGNIAFQGRLFAFGGFNVDGITAKVHSYLPAANQWFTNHADMPVELAYLAPVATATHIHLLGGTSMSGPTDSHLIYNPFLNTWTTGAPLPVTAQSPAAVFLDGKIHVFGGHQGGRALNAHYVYDVAADTWSTAAPMPIESFQMAAVIKGKTIHVIEGLPARATADSAHHIYDTTSGTWAPSFPVPAPRSPVRATIINDRLYVLSGTSADKAYSLSLKPAYYVHVKQ